MLPSDSDAAACASVSVYSWSRISTAATSAGDKPPESQPLASRPHRRQQHVRPGRDQNERGSRRRLLQRFQQRVLRFGIHRIGVVDDDDAPAAFERPIGGPLDRVAHLIDLDRAGVARLDEQHVGVHAARNALAGAHTPHAPAASCRRSVAAFRQFINCARATAASRLPTPSGPAKIRLGGSVPRIRRPRDQFQQVTMPGDVAKCHEGDRIRT